VNAAAWWEPRSVAAEGRGEAGSEKVRGRRSGEKTTVFPRPFCVPSGEGGWQGPFARVLSATTQQRRRGEREAAALRGWLRWLHLASTCGARTMLPLRVRQPSARGPQQCTVWATCVGGRGVRSRRKGADVGGEAREGGGRRVVRWQAVAAGYDLLATGVKAEDCSRCSSE